MDWYTFRGCNSAVFIFATHLNEGRILKDNLLPSKEMLSFTSKSIEPYCSIKDKNYILAFLSAIGLRRALLYRGAKQDVKR